MDADTHVREVKRGVHPVKQHPRGVAAQDVVRQALQTRVSQVDSVEICRTYGVSDLELRTAVTVSDDAHEKRYMQQIRGMMRASSLRTSRLSSRCAAVSESELPSLSAASRLFETSSTPANDASVFSFVSMTAIWMSLCIK